MSGLSATETHTYSYTDSTWGDILTAYNGQAVTYDAMGNITSLDGDTYIRTADRSMSYIPYCNLFFFCGIILSHIMCIYPKKGRYTYENYNEH